MTFKQEIQQSILDRFQSSEELQSIYLKMQNGTADYGTAQQFSQALGDIATDVLNKYDYTGLNLYDIADNVVEVVGKVNNHILDDVCGEIQLQMNESISTGIKPQIPANNYERMKGIKDQVINAQSNDEIYKATEGLKNLAQSHVDDWVKENADFQAKAGLGPVVVRLWSGKHPSHDTKHTDLCEKMAGIYEYGNAGSGVPDEVWQRHEGCRCQVKFYPSAKSHGKITSYAKGTNANGTKWTTDNKQALSRRKQISNKNAIEIIENEFEDTYTGDAFKSF